MILLTIIKYRVMFTWLTVRKLVHQVGKVNTEHWTKVILDQCGTVHNYSKRQLKISFGVMSVC